MGDTEDRPHRIERIGDLLSFRLGICGAILSANVGG